jgi:hypothetical protein
MRGFRSRWSLCLVGLVLGPVAARAQVGAGAGIALPAGG